MEINPLVEQGAAIVDDCYKFYSGDAMALQDLVNDLKGLVSKYGAFDKSKCDFEGFVKAAKSATPESISANYFRHFFTISKDLNVVKSCSSDYSSCGVAGGEIVRLELGWSLN